MNHLIPDEKWPYSYIVRNSLEFADPDKIRKEKEFSILWKETYHEFAEAAELEDFDKVLQIVDAWIDRWEAAGDISHPTKVIYLASLGVLWANPGIEALTYANKVSNLARKSGDLTSSEVVGWVVQSYAAVTEEAGLEETRIAATFAREFAYQVYPPNERVDAELARALRNLAAEENTLEKALVILEEIRSLALRHPHPVPDIEEHISEVRLGLKGLGFSFQLIEGDS